jgi:hypothetical protein
MSQSFRRNVMKVIKLPATLPGHRQMNLLFDTTRLEALGCLERNKITVVLAQILMQAAGLSIEELDDDER